MNYVVDMTIPLDTAKADMERQEIRLPKGVVKKVSIYFPWGCAGMVSIVVFEYEHQVWPTQHEKYYRGNEVLIEFPEDHDLPDEWNLFSVRGWSPGTEYEHTPIVSITVLEDKEPSWLRSVLGRLLGVG